MTWSRTRWKRNVTCRACGATRDYIQRTENGFKCTLCGKTWQRIEI